MFDFIDFMKFFMTLSLLGLAFVGSLAAGIYYVDGRLACDRSWPGRETHWGFFEGCLVETKRGMVPARTLNLNELDVIE